MAVSALPRTRASVPHQAATLSPIVLVVTLIAPTLDLLAMVESGLAMPLAGLLATSAASAILVLSWVRFPRTSWLLAAALASCASVAMRLVGADVAPLLSLLAIVGLGIGGAFASPARKAEAWLT